MTVAPRILVLAALLAGCGSDGRHGATTRADRIPGRVAAAPADSLALRAPHGVEIWFTGSRSDADSAGKPCIERTMQIRRDTVRINIPLLYTGAVPVLVNDSTIEAPIWLHCRPGNVYRVSLRTGQPERVR